MMRVALVLVIATVAAACGSSASNASSLYLEARDGAPFICSYLASGDPPDAGPIDVSTLTWSCFGPAALGTRYDFFMEVTTAQSSASGSFFVRFADEADGGDAGSLRYEAGGCFDTSSGNARCASPDTPIATPTGERAIDSLAVGDLVYSNDGDGWRAVPIERMVRVPVLGHHVVRLTLDDGRAVAMSAMHPDAHGRTFGELARGDRLGERTIMRTERIDFDFPYTVDIRPASRSGTYVAAGALVGTTLCPR